MNSNFNDYSTKSFKVNGFMKAKGLFDIDLINDLSNKLLTSEEIGKLNGSIYDDENGKKFIRYVPQPQIAEPAFLKLVTSRLLEIGSKLLSEEVYFSGIDIHCRAANTKDPTPPHQDSFLACFEDGFESLVTCYLSLTGMNDGSANLRFIKGSHLNPTMPHQKSLIRGFSSVISDSSELLPKELIRNEEIISLEKGECIFFHSKLIHYTNQTEKPKKNRSSAAIRISGFSAKYSLEKQKVYKENLNYNRAKTIKEGLTDMVSKPQHND